VREARPPRPASARLPLGPAASAFAALALLAAGWALTLWIAPWNDESVNDLFVYRTFSAPMLDGGLPYRDIAFEYPPLAAPAIVLPGLIGTGAEEFRWAFAVWTLAGAVAIVLLCGALARRTGGAPRRAMFAAAAMPLLCGAVLHTHFDLFPVALVLASLLLLARDRPRAGFAVLGLAVMTKAFPIVIAPVAIAWLLGRGRPRDAWQGALVLAAVIAAIAGAAIAASPDGALDAVRYHLDRPVQIESSPALVLLGLDAVGAGRAESVASFRSDGLLHPAAGAIESLFLTALVALVALLCAAVAGRATRRHSMGTRSGWGALRRDGDEKTDHVRGGRVERRVVDADRRSLILAGLAACAGFALLGKVLSPQFVIWVLPLGALAFAWRMHALAVAVALVAVLTQIEFPAHYFDVVAREPLAIGVVAMRNVALAAVIALAVRELRAVRTAPRPALATSPRAAA
jgi:uncharacterized membrane protein (DUF441 family)